MMGELATKEAAILPATAPPIVTAIPVLAASDNDAFFEYGYVWLPYAVAALVLFALGAVAAVRWRKSSPGTAELLITSGALLAVLAAIVLGLSETNESFPSGHALASAAILGVVLVVLLPLRGRATRIGVLLGVGLFVVAIGLSRLYLGVHWATDVLGGWVTGLAWLALCLTARQLWRQTRGHPERLVSEPAPPPEAVGGSADQPDVERTSPATRRAAARPDDVE